MAQKVIHQLVDDLDGTISVDVTTVPFGLDGVTYEIDVTAENAERLREALRDYIAAGRRVAGRRRTGSSSVKAGLDPQQATAMREWGQANGMPVAARGRIPREVQDAFHANGGMSIAPATEAPEAASPPKTRRSRAKTVSAPVAAARKTRSKAAAK